MSDIKVASRYAKSLLDLAVEKQVLEEIHADMQTFDQVCEENRDFYLMLKNPIIQHSKKLSILNEIFDKKFHEMSLAIFRLIIQKQRESFLPAIAKQFQLQYNIHKGIENASVTTTFALTDDLRASFAAVVKEITGKKVALKEKVDEQLLGGFILKIGDRQIDDSLSGKLRELKLKFNHNPYIKAF